MQYILSEEEYNYLKNELSRTTEKLNNTIQYLCTNVANYKPIKFWDNKKKKVWGCYKTYAKEWYCDECPVQEVCPEKNKRWSK